MESLYYYRSRRITHYLPNPWPKAFSLRQICTLQKSCKEFSHTSVAQHIGRIGILPRWWTEDHQDWYLDILQFVCIRTVKRDEETVLGPFSVVRSEGVFVLLEDESQQQFFFPKYLQRYEFGRKFYSCTAIWLYTSGCYCRRCVDLQIPLPVYCFCIEVFNRSLCLGCSYDLRVHPREEIADSQVNAEHQELLNIKVQPSAQNEHEQQDENKDIDELLSQNLCLYREVFGSQSTCFCGYGISTEKDENSREGTQAATDNANDATDVNAGSSRQHQARHQQQRRNADDCTRKKQAAKVAEVKVKKSRRVPEKTFDVSITIGILGNDIQGQCFDKMVNFLESRAEMDVLGLERGDSHLQLHIQGMLRITTSSARALKTESAIKNVSDKQKEEGRRMHAIYGASEYKNRLELNPANSVELADVDNILFGIDTHARYFEAPTTVKLENDEEDDPPPEEDDIPLPTEDEATPIPIVNLERTKGSGADLDRVQEALLGASFDVGRKTNEEMETSKLLPEYIRLWR
ncbi:hypothetical protein R1sor_021708 [Riccia sorocarpa]|uniref:Uncharacterized protein n=1 Tax=Riccia sorocarpa TaxID=122646 RepID=A0ABD3GHS3_9MARC